MAGRRLLFKSPAVCLSTSGNHDAALRIRLSGLPITKAVPVKKGDFGGGVGATMNLGVCFRLPAL